MGCILYELVNLRKAFNPENRMDLYKAIRESPVSSLERSFHLEPILKMYLCIFIFYFKEKTLNPLTLEFKVCLKKIKKID